MLSTCRVKRDEIETHDEDRLADGDPLASLTAPPWVGVLPSDEVCCSVASVDARPETSLAIKGPSGVCSGQATRRLLQMK